MSDIVGRHADKIVSISLRLSIEHLVWDDWNREHLTKHAVLPEEAEEVIAAEPVVLATYKGRFQLIGINAAERARTVINGPVPDRPGVHYVFSARPTSRMERRFHAGQQRGISE